MSLDNISMEEIADTYGIGLDLLSTVFEEISSTGLVKSTLSNIMTTATRPKTYSQKMRDTKFSDTSIGLRLSSVFRHHIYSDFLGVLQNSKNNLKLQGLQQTVYETYDSLVNKHKDEPTQLFINLRITLCKIWKLIPDNITNEPNKQRQKTLLDSNQKALHALVLVDIIILLGFIECPLFTDIRG